MMYDRKLLLMKISIVERPIAIQATVATMVTRVKWEVRRKSSRSRKQ